MMNKKAQKKNVQNIYTLNFKETLKKNLILLLNISNFMFSYYESPRNLSHLKHSKVLV